MKTKTRNKIEKNNQGIYMIYLRGIITAYIFVLFIFLIMALILTYTDVSEALIPMVASVTMIVSASISGMYVGAKMEKRGWLNGAVEGVIYVILLIIMSWVFVEDFGFDKYVFLKSVVGIVAAGIGGMIGVNIK